MAITATPQQGNYWMGGRAEAFQRRNRLRQGVKNDNGLVGAGNHGLGDGNQLVLLTKDAQAGDRCAMAIELRRGAGRQFGTTGLDLGHEHIELGAVANAFLENWENIGSRVIGQQILE